MSKDYVKHIFVTVVAIRNARHMIDLLLNIYWVNELGILLKVKNQQFSLELVLSNATLNHLILQCSYFSLFVVYFSFPLLEYNFHGYRDIYLFCWWYKTYNRELEYSKHSINIFWMKKIPSLEIMCNVFLSSLLRYNLHTVHYIYFKCVIPWVLTNDCTHVTTMMIKI